MHKYVCEACKKIFYSYTKNRRFCGNKCSAQTISNKGRFQKGRTGTKEQKEYRIKKIRENPGGHPLGKPLSEEHKRKIMENRKRPSNYIDGGYKNKIPMDKCEICKTTKRKICIHHKDKNRKNNDIKNLSALCYSCHKKEDNRLNGKINKLDWSNKNDVRKYKKYKAREYRKNL